MARRHFLTGVTAGLGLGVVLSVTTYRLLNTMQPPAQPTRHLVVMPSSETIRTPRHPATPSVPPAIPPDARRHEFNGRPYYMIPLSRQAEDWRTLSDA